MFLIFLTPETNEMKKQVVVVATIIVVVVIIICCMFFIYGLHEAKQMAPLTNPAT